MREARYIRLALATVLAGGTCGAAIAADIPVGHLATNTGETSSVAQIYAQGLTDAWTTSTSTAA